MSASPIPGALTTPAFNVPEVEGVTYYRILGFIVPLKHYTRIRDRKRLGILSRHVIRRQERARKARAAKDAP